jgi:Ser/Thr protein kinase RdoA (MazF antagonist)
MYVFIPGTVTYQKMSDPAMGFEAGKIIGQFQALLSDLKTELVETIPDFHNIDWRIRQYQQAKHENPAGRLTVVEDDLRFAEQRFDRMSAYYRSLKEKAVVRATHNDTKLNNILFDPGNKALCLIDLDTVMPGYVHFDYGDALRTMANTALEDEKDLSKVKFNSDIYHSFTRGYLEEAEGFLIPDERARLPYAPIYLTFIIGLRFLTDFINGDVYFRVHHPEHNLERARVQLMLVREMEKVLNFEF